MALSRVKTWISGEVLTASDLNAEFNNILNNATSLISPATGTWDLNGNELVLDANGDTSITADTDDQIDFRIGGSDRASITANRALNLAKVVQGSTGICNLRLSLTSGTSVTTADVTAATTIYAALHGGNQVALWDGSTDWIIVETAELSLSVPATTNTMYDMFLDYNDGTPQLAATAWTNDTTRATALTTQDGVLVKTGDTQQRYLGSFRTTGVSGQTEDSAANRLVYNYYNQVPRKLKKVDTTATWTYATATWRSMNNSTANRVGVVVGVAGSQVSLTNSHLVSCAGGVTGYVGIAADATNTNGADMTAAFEDTVRVRGDAFMNDTPAAAGYHFYQAVEYASGSTVTYHGAYGQFAASGLNGFVIM